MPVDLDELERLHKAAGAEAIGKWHPTTYTYPSGDVEHSLEYNDGYGIADISISFDHPEHIAAFIAAIKNACDDGLLERLREAERMSDLGCDAADGGPHTVIAQGKYNFCGKCGVTVKRPTLSERARAAEACVRATEAKLFEADSLVLLTTMRAETAEASFAALKAENERLRGALELALAEHNHRCTLVVTLTEPGWVPLARTALETTNG